MVGVGCALVNEIGGSQRQVDNMAIVFVRHLQNRTTERRRNVARALGAVFLFSHSAMLQDARSGETKITMARA